MITAPAGYRFATAYAGFRSASQGERDDVALVVSDVAAVAAAVFTTNQFPAAPVTVGRELIARRPSARAVLINAGLANASSGEQGIANCRITQALLASLTGLSPEDVLPASTGVIGPRFDMGKWERIMPVLADRLGSGSPETFTRAIMTTDAFPKMADREVPLSGGSVRLAGLAKGAGMICPNMATMLCVVLCDAAVEASAWSGLLKTAVARTFNRVTVDGDTSTNDTVYALANGRAGVSAVSPADLALLGASLEDVLGRLAYMLVQDGEGSSKVAHIAVKGAASDADAEQVARTVGHSPLVKTALYGRDPNWGRIVMAIGRSGVKLTPENVRVSLCGVELFRNGQPVDMDVDAVFAEPLKGRDVPITITLGDGPGSYTLLASDLGREYVNCNASYRS